MIEVQRATVAPEFSMADSEGGTVRLSDYRGKKNVVLVFNRGFA
jgi:peroxiredoxin